MQGTRGNSIYLNWIEMPIDHTVIIAYDEYKQFKSLEHTSTLLHLILESITCGSFQVTSFLIYHN